jgi:hypothetical protein
VAGPVSDYLTARHWRMLATDLMVELLRKRINSIGCQGAFGYASCLSCWEQVVAFSTRPACTGIRNSKHEHSIRCSLNSVPNLRLK